MTYVALLRGINVGGKRPLRMSALQETVARAGGRNVTTYIQSGNVVFDHASRSAAEVTAQLQRAIAKTAGFDVPVVLRTARELAQVIERNPFATEPPEHLHVMFLPARTPESAVAKIDATRYLPDRFTLQGREGYFCLPNGIGRSQLGGAIANTKALAGGTVRNWRTVLALRELTTQRSA